MRLNYRPNPYVVGARQVESDHGFVQLVTLCRSRQRHDPACWQSIHLKSPNTSPERCIASGIGRNSASLQGCSGCFNNESSSEAVGPRGNELAQALACRCYEHILLGHTLFPRGLEQLPLDLRKP